MTRHASFSPRQRRAFTLIELLVVLAIAAVISAVTLGGFKEMREGNKRVSCSANLTQIYQAARLYAADEGGKFPLLEYDNPDDCTSNVSGIGLWSLYTFPKGKGATEYSSIAYVDDRPIERYVRSTKVLHCPADLVHDQLYLAPVLEGTEYKTPYDPEFLSYQTCDGSLPTYTTKRNSINLSSATATQKEMWKRQLTHYTDDGTTEEFVNRQPTGDTVVTYCIHHRNERGMDNVLFYDGSIQLMKQNEGGLTGWQRTPKAPQ